MFWFLLGVLIAVLGGLVLVAAVRVVIAIFGGILRLLFGIFSIFDNND